MSACRYDKLRQVLERCVSILENEKEKEKEGRDLELDDNIGQMEIAEYQVNKLRRIIASRLDKTNPVAFSKRSSIHAFEFDGKVYRITVEADTFDIGDRSTTNTFKNALKSPAFIITSSMFLGIICVLALVSLYWTFPVLGTLSDSEMDRLDRQYSQILDLCASLLNDDRPNPRSFGAPYSTCNKAIVQLDGFCKENNIATCEDERIELYSAVDKPRP
jgi:hypothetical protein